MYKGMCVVSNAGAREVDGRAIFLLKTRTGEFPGGRNFTSTGTLSREMLAVGLAAIASNKEVYCEIPDETTEWSEIHQINLMSGK